MRHSCIGFDIVIKEVVDSLVTAGLDAANPRPLNGCFRRRDHEEHEDQVTEPGEQMRVDIAIFLNNKTVKAKPVDQQMGHQPFCSLRGHVAVQLLVDDFKFMAGQHRGVFVGLPE